MLKRYPIESQLVAIGCLVLVVSSVFQWGVLHTQAWTSFGGHIPNNQNFIPVIGVPLDDVYIHCRFAQNLLRGYGYSFNPGELISGDTSPLWVVLLAGFGYFTSHLDMVSIFLSAFFYLMLGPGVYRVARDVFHIEERWSIVAGIIVVLGSRLIWSAMSGMEVTLAALIVLLAVEEHERGRTLGNPRLREAIWLGIGYNIRPEFLLLIGLIYLDWFIITVRAGQLNTTILRAVGVTLLLVLPYPIFSFVVDGTFLSHSSIVQGVRLSFIPNIYYLGFAVYVFASNNIPSFIFAVVGVILFWRRREWRITILFVVGLPVLQAFVAPQVRHHGRYLFPVFPLMAILGAASGQEILRRINEKKQLTGRWIRPAFIFTLVLFGGVEATRWIAIESEGVRNINDQHLAIVNWVQGNLNLRDTLAADDVGALAYFTNRKIVDLTGLMTPSLWELRNNQDAVWQQARAMGANFFIIYDRLNPQFLLRHRDSLHFITSFTVRPPLSASADTTMSLYRLKL